MEVHFLFHLHRFTCLQLRLEFPVLSIIIQLTGMATFPPTNYASLPRQFVSSVTLWNDSFATMVVILNFKFF